MNSATAEILHLSYLHSPAIKGFQMSKHSPLIILFFIALYCFSLPGYCSAMPPLDPASFPKAPNYTEQQSWLSKPSKATLPVDVFFVYPTVLFNDSDWLMDLSDTKSIGGAQSTIETQASVFKGQANIYAPLYRQMNLAGLKVKGKDAKLLANAGFDDVLRAFTYYLKHENKGRPFFLAGHSQGSMILTNLMLEKWGKTGAEERFIAALLIGWTITKGDLETHDNIKMCADSAETNCIISYNTMAEGRQGAAPTLRPDSVTVNPLSWSTDGRFVAASFNRGAVFFDRNNKPAPYAQFTSAQIVEGGLIVQPKNIDLVTVKGGHFPAGVYHAFDYSLFYENLKANIAERIEHFMKK